VLIRQIIGQRSQWVARLSASVRGWKAVMDAGPLVVDGRDQRYRIRENDKEHDMTSPSPSRSLVHRASLARVNQVASALVSLTPERRLALARLRPVGVSLFNERCGLGGES